MNWPFVSRGRFEDAQKQVDRAYRQIDDLTAANVQLVKALNMKHEAVQEPEKPEEMTTKPRRKLGIEIRQEATKEAIRRAAEKGKR